MDPRDYAVLSLDGRGLPYLPKQAFKTKSPVRPKDPRDAALGDALVTGVIKNIGLLEHTMQHHTKRVEVDAKVRLILWVALYQLLLLDRVPDHALVNVAVEQCRTLKVPRASGFVNALLRTAIRDGEVPLPDRSSVRQYCKIALSHPLDCVDKLIATVGRDGAIESCEHDNREPPILVRLVQGKTLDDLAAVCPALTLEPHEQPGIVVVTGGKVADFATIADAGVGQVQDATSAATVDHLALDRPGLRILDRCCGVGTKTRQIVEQATDADILATDASGKRVRTLRKALPGIDAVRLEFMRDSPLGDRRFDRILIDAPCSNSGVMARRPEARYHQSKDEIASVVELQQAILADTAPFLASGGRLVYATCSIWPDENDAIADAFAASHPDLREVERVHHLPGGTGPTYRDGGFVAVFERPD
ncbi:MAG: transcription antitermination factor NusB [Planctomycetota bacterium]